MSDTPPVTETTIPAEGAAAPEDRTYTAAEVAELKQEAQRLREERNQFSDAFTDYNEDERGAMLELVRKVAAEPGEAATIFRTLAEQLAAETGVTQEQAEDAVQEAAGITFSTPEELEKFLDERDAKRAKAAQEAEYEKHLVAEASKFGYPEGSPEETLLWHFAAEETEGDFNKANDLVKSFRQQIIDEFAQSEAQRASQTMPVSDGTAQVEGAPKAPDLKGARKAVEDFLNKAYSDNQ